MALTPDQVRELSKIIMDHASYFTWVVLGDKAVSKEELDQLKEAGILPPETDLDMIEYSFVLGKLESLLTKKQYDGLSYEDLKVEAAKSSPRTFYEKKTIENIRATAGDKIRALGDKIKNETISTINQETEKHLQQSAVKGTIKDVLEHGVAERRTIVQIGYDLGRKLRDAPVRDFIELAFTELKDAQTKGYVSAILNKEGKFASLDGADTKIVFIVQPDACPECKEAYLNKDGSPRVFILKDLLKNNSNVGIPKKLRNVGKTGDQNVRAVIPPHHPWCLLPKNKLVTAAGEVSIEDVSMGDGVLSPLGNWRKVRQVQKRFYEGAVVDVEIDGRIISVTGNHLLETVDGWCRADQITDRSELIKVFLSESDNCPPPTFKKSRFAKVLFLLSSSGVPVTAVDFDGYLARRVTDINDKDIHSIIRFEKNFVFPERFEETLFQIRERSACHPFDLLNNFVSWSFSPSPCFMSSTGILFSLEGSEFLVSDFLSLSHSSLSDSGFMKSADDHSSGYPQLVGYLKYGEVFVEVHGEDLGDIELDLFRHTANVERHSVTVKCLDRRNWSGWVHNVHVDKDESFVVNGISSHNCTCILRALPKGAKIDKEGMMKVEDLEEFSKE